MSARALAMAASLEPPSRTLDLRRRLAAEMLGTGLLLAIVVGSGMMGERLSNGNAALALLGNTLATGAGLVVLITVFAPLSGAHFNPAVTLVFALNRDVGWRTGAAYVAAQVAGAVLGVWIAHAMFAVPIVQIATKLRDGPAQIFAEFVATFGLVAVILGSIRRRPAATPALVGLYVTAAYWFTASTSFANPAVTVARALSDSFAGIVPHAVPGFVAAQIGGAVTGAALSRWLFTEDHAA